MVRVLLLIATMTLQSTLVLARAEPADSAGGLLGQGSFESYPRRVSWEPPSRSGDLAGDTLARFIVCQVRVSATGLPDSVRVFGCEGPKSALCDDVIAALGHARFHPATIAGRPVAATCVFGVTFPSGRTRVARAGIPVIGFWADSLCAYDGRIYGSAELSPEFRPVVRRRARAAFPERGRGYPAAARVKLRAVVDPSGLVCFVLCESAQPAALGFEEAAVDAARRFEFEPGRLDGRPQAVWVDIDFLWDPRE